MASRKIILKKNSLSGSIPSSSELSVGELAINTADGIIYTKLNDGSISSTAGGAIGGGGAGIVSWNSITNKPSVFTPSAHNHNISDITGLVGILTAKADSNNPVFTGTVSGITKLMVGLSNVDNTSDINKPVSSAQASADESIKTFSIQRSNHTGTQPISSVSGLQTALDNKQNAGSYATLVNGLIPSSQLPSFVDDVLEYESLNLFPNTGSTGKIYVATNTNKTYRWTGSAYIEISPSPGSTDSVPEGSINKYYTDLRASAAAPVQSVAGRTGSVILTKNDVSLDNIDNTSDINKPISNATQNALNLKANINNPNFTGTVGGITKNMVGLSNVDNTSDLEKPISTAQAAINTLLQNDATTKANNAQSYAIQRSNHTGIQPMSSVENLTEILSTKSDNDHQHDRINFNTAIGTNALINMSSGYRNVSIGYDSLSQNTVGYNNIAIGAPALWQNVNGYNNTSIGSWSSIFNISGSDNTAVGVGALTNNVNGSFNTAIGGGALFNTTTGVYNIGIGPISNVNNTTGSNNIVVGYNSNTALGNFNNCIILGSNATANASGEFVLGSTQNQINTSSTVGATGAASILPTRPLGYLQIRLNNILVKIPYYRE